MAKKSLNVTIRKASSAPPSEKTESTLDAFVNGARAGFRTFTLYLPDALADRLADYCRANDRDLSAVVAEMIEKQLDTPAPVPVVERIVEVHHHDDPLTALRRWVQMKLRFVTVMRPAWRF
jgi:hypothetical protein